MFMRKRFHVGGSRASTVQRTSVVWFERGFVGGLSLSAEARGKAIATRLSTVSGGAMFLNSAHLEIKRMISWRVVEFFGVAIYINSGISQDNSNVTDCLGYLFTGFPGV
jgi:hypothetical protein